MNVDFLSLIKNFYFNCENVNFNIEDDQLPLKNGVIGRRFQENWKKLYAWIIYDNMKDKVFCSECKIAVKNNIILLLFTIKDKNAIDAFVENGFSGWR